MPLTSLQQVQDVVTRAGLTRMIAYDASGYTVDHAEEDTAGALSQRIEECVSNNTGTIRVEAWQPPPARIPGQRKADAPKVERYSWHLRGTYGQVNGSAPVPPAPIAEPTATRGPQDIAEALRTARLEWEVELLRVQLKEANTRAVATDDDDDDDDDDDERPASLWGMTGDQTFQLLQGLGQLVPELLSGVTGKTIGAAPGIKPASRQELEVLEAMRRYQAANPDEANGILSALMETYGNKAKPPADGK